MKICIIENNLVGLLTAIYHFYHTIKDIDIITSDTFSIMLIDEVINIESEVTLARKVRSGIIKKVGQSGYNDIANAYLSSDKDKEQKIFEYLKQVFKYGNETTSMFTDPYVIAFNYMLKKVLHESHRMTGFIRFQEMDNGIYYSYFGTDNDVLELMIPHFVARFNNQQFVLHDIGRKKMAYYDGEKYHTLLAPDKIEISLSDNEYFMRKLWKEYNQNVSIDIRKNIKLQNHYVPKKYRWFMNEF